MLFRILTENNNIFYYDNLRNRIYDSSKQIFSKKFQQVKNKPENRVEPFDFTDEKYAYPKKDKRIRQLKIQLGTNCNQKCSYCIQAAGNYKVDELPKKEDIDNFFKMFYDADLRVTENFKIHLWGGEPLVYWKTLLYLIPKLRNFWPTAQIWFVSNGTAIDIDKLSFLIENRVELAFSHDGTAQALRGYNPLENDELKALWYYTFAKYKENNLNFRLNTVLSEQNADLYALDAYFTNYFGNEISYKYEDTIIAHSSNAVQFIGFSKRAENLLINTIDSAINYNSNPRIYAALRQMPTEVLRRLCYQVPAEAIRAKCNAVNADVLSVDLKTGNVLSCHNVAQDWTMGSLLDYNSIKVDKFKHWSLRDNCPKCPYLSACQGGCARNNDEMHAISCRSRKVLAKAVFYAVLHQYLGEKVKEITYEV